MTLDIDIDIGIASLEPQAIADALSRLLAPRCCRRSTPCS